MDLDRLEDRIDVIRAQIQHGHHTIAAKESAALIEFAYKEFYRRSLGRLTVDDRRKVFEVEQEIGEGRRSVEDFTFGQLVGLFHRTRFLKRWSDATSASTRGLQIIRIERLVGLRNAIVHEQHEVGRAEAELFLSCLQTVLETFGILSLEDAFGAPPREQEKPNRIVNRQVDRSGQMGRKSGYRWEPAAEQTRLRLQAESTLAFDRQVVGVARSRMADTAPLFAIDLGCSDGEVTASLLTSELGFARVLGVDREEDAIARANQRGQSHLDFVVMDLEDPQLVPRLEHWLRSNRGEHFSLVFSALTLHHLASPIRLLRNLRHLMAPRTAMVVRGFDDASMMLFPDPEERVERIVELTARQPGVSDRYNGRRLYHWLYRAGFRDIQLMTSLRTTADLTSAERHQLFIESFEFRRRYFVDIDDAASPRALRDDRRELEELLVELELDFEDESTVFLELDIAAVAWT